MFSPNAKLYEGSLTNMQPTHGSLIGTITGLSSKSGAKENTLTFTAKYPEDPAQATLLFSSLAKDIGKTVNIWVVDGAMEHNYKGLLSGVNTHSDITTGRVIDKFELIVIIPHE